jgi:alpha-glucosidase
VKAMHQYARRRNWKVIFSRDQPRTLEVLGELRALVDQYSERYLIGEVLDVDMIAVSSKYTRTGEHLHSCYTFELMQQRFDASLLRRAIELTEESLGTGWTTWAGCRMGSPPAIVTVFATGVPI